MKFLSICISMLLSAFPALGVLYDFESKAQLEDWEIGVKEGKLR